MNSGRPCGSDPFPTHGLCAPGNTARTGGKGAEGGSTREPHGNHRMLTCSLLPRAPLKSPGGPAGTWHGFDTSKLSTGEGSLQTSPALLPPKPQGSFPMAHIQLRPELARSRGASFGLPPPPVRSCEVVLPRTPPCDSECLHRCPSEITLRAPQQGHQEGHPEQCRARAPRHPQLGRGKAPWPNRPPSTPGRELKPDG